MQPLMRLSFGPKLVNTAQNVSYPHTHAYIVIPVVDGHNLVINSDFLEGSFFVVPRHLSPFPSLPSCALPNLIIVVFWVGCGRAPS